MAIRDAFLRQAQACTQLGSPFTARLCNVLPDTFDPGTAFGHRVLGWPEEKLVADAVALRCCGALHALVRRAEAPELAALYPPHRLPGAADLTRGVAGAVAAHDGFLTAFLDGPPQTNEVARSGVLLGGFATVARETGLPLSVFEIGASAGLNMLFDRYRYELAPGIAWGAQSATVTVPCEWSGAMPPLDAPIRVAARAGCDMNPVRAGDAQDRARLLDYIWPDQTERLARIEAALDEVAASGLVVEAADAAEWVRRVLPPAGPAGVCRVLFHSIMWQYMPAETQVAVRGRIEACGAAATAEAPFAWLRLEADGLPDSGLRLTLWPGGREREMARARYHGRSAHWL